MLTDACVVLQAWKSGGPPHRRGLPGRPRSQEESGREEGNTEERAWTGSLAKVSGPFEGCPGYCWEF